jgi:hypothetical protein
MTVSWEPRIAKLEKHSEDIGPRIVALEERSKTWATVLGFAAVILIGLLGWGGSQLYTLNANVGKLSGQVSSLTPKAISDLFAADTNNKEIIARNAQLAAALISSARKSSLRSNKKELAISSLALSQLVTRHSDISELWQASAQLASYRSELASSISANLPNCKDVAPKQKSNWEELLKEQASPGSHLDYPDTKITPYIYANCKQNLNEFDELIKKNPHLEVQPLGSHPGTVITAPYIFESSLISYDSNRSLPDTILEFRDCVFQLEVMQEPIERSQELVLALLTSDTRDVKLPASN